MLLVRGKSNFKVPGVEASLGHLAARESEKLEHCEEGESGKR